MLGQHHYADATMQDYCPDSLCKPLSPRRHLLLLQDVPCVGSYNSPDKEWYVNLLAIAAMTYPRVWLDIRELRHALSLRHVASVCVVLSYRIPAEHMNHLVLRFTK